MICKTGFVTNGIERAKQELENAKDRASGFYPTSGKAKNKDASLYLSLYDWDKEFGAFSYFREVKDTAWVLELTKHLVDYTGYYIRLYPDCSGYIVYQNRHELEILSYFALDKDKAQHFKEQVVAELKRIVSNPVPLEEDDNTRMGRVAASLCLSFNIAGMLPDAIHHISPLFRYENRLWCSFEDEIPIIREFVSLLGMDGKLRILQNTQTEEKEEPIGDIERYKAEDIEEYTQDPEDELED